jgi:hypothetical protein
MVNVPSEGNQEEERTGQLFKKSTGPPKKTAPRVQRVSIFIPPQALTFPIAVGLVKVAWEGFKRLPVSWAGTLWLPFGACLLIGMLITLENIRAGNLSARMRLLGLFVGMLNSCVMFAAVLGITK